MALQFTLPAENKLYYTPQIKAIVSIQIKCKNEEERGFTTSAIPLTGKKGVIFIF